MVGYFLFFVTETFFTKNESLFYNIGNLSKNFVAYAQIILGNKANFLWIMHPISSIGMFLSIILNFLYSRNKPKIWKKVVPLLLVFCSLFFLLLTFYLTDSRYIIYIIPIYIVLFSLTTPRELFLSYKFLIFFLFISHIFSQIPLFKKIISENIFHRSVAWQYEASKIIGDFSSHEQNSQIITALPPHLVAAYTNDQSILLPLSNSQEFLQKKQYIWGEKINYNNLLLYYKEQVAAGENIYITNSYITHQQSVIDDYEAYKTEFTFKLIKEGCLGACNIYKLELLLF
jgi:hypothetical protein